jgi:DNA-binding GntR family transcriptional regulator
MRRSTAPPRRPPKPSRAPLAPAGEDEAIAFRGETAYRRLHRAIQEGQLRPGERLREVELASRLGASRTPIREALARLEHEGLAARDPVRGMIVAELDAGAVAELYVMREVLEGTAAALAARHASDAEIAALRGLADRDREIRGDPVRLANNNRLFHETLYRSARNRYLLKTLSSLREALALLGQTTLALHGRSGTALEEHAELIAALERRDPAAAEEAARAHIRAAYRARLALMLEEEAA